MQIKEKSRSDVFSTGGDLAVDETLSPPALQMPNGKGQRKEAPGGETSRRHKCGALLRAASRQEKAKYNRGLREEKEQKPSWRTNVCSCG